MMTAKQLYRELYESYGKPRWWSEDPYHVMVQSILVQNTNWSSVEKVADALGNKLNPEYIGNLTSVELEEMIRPCGFAKRKAETIQRVTVWFSTSKCGIVHDMKYDEK